MVFDGFRIITPRAIKKQTLDFVMLPPKDCRKMEKPSIYVPMSKPLDPRFLMPKSFFLFKNKIKLKFKIFFQQIQVIRKTILLGQSGYH